MPRKMRTAKRRQLHDLSAMAQYLLLFGELPPRDAHGHYAVDGNPFEMLSILYGDGDRAFEEKWTAARDELLAAWIQERPGSRPYGWWLLDAPRRIEAGQRTPSPDPRQHLSGCGQPDAVGIYPSMLARQRGVLPFRHVDPQDPPYVEAEAAYLQRHGLLTADERRRLTADAFAPQPFAPDAETV